MKFNRSNNIQKVLNKQKIDSKKSQSIVQQISIVSTSGYIIADSIKEINSILTEFNMYKGVIINGESCIAVRVSEQSVSTFPAFICNKHAEEKIDNAYNILLKTK